MQFLLHSYQSGSTITSNKNTFQNMHNTRQVSTIDEGPLRIHIGNIPFSWSEKHLREQFEIFGPIEDVEVVSNGQGSKGFGFLTFLRRRDADRAMRVKHGTIADGRKVTVSLAVAKSHSSSSSSLTPPQTPARMFHQSLNQPVPSNRKLSLLSPDAPMWMPITPPSMACSFSPESQSNGWSNQSRSLSSSPISVLLPPLAHTSTTANQDKTRSQWYATVDERIVSDRLSSKFCPHCGRSI